MDGVGSFTSFSAFDTGTGVGLALLFYLSQFSVVNTAAVDSSHTSVTATHNNFPLLAFSTRTASVFPAGCFVVGTVETCRVFFYYKQVPLHACQQRRWTTSLTDLPRFA